jgi:RNA polymerase sigma-70 factor (ECF subfamily)
LTAADNGSKVSAQTFIFHAFICGGEMNSPDRPFSIRHRQYPKPEINGKGGLVPDQNPPIPLDELARRLRDEGDNEARHMFIAFFFPRLTAYFGRRRLPESVAEQLAFECVMRVIEKIDLYHPIEQISFAAWIYRIAHNAMVDWFRRNPPTLSLDEISDPAQEPMIDDPTEAFPPEAGRRALEALEQLDEIDRQIIELHEVESEMTFGAIAEFLNMKEGTVRQRYNRALKKLQQILQADPHVKDWQNNK